MQRMFWGCSSFNQPLKWNTCNVRNTSFMFYWCTSFDQPLNWNMYNNMRFDNMFGSCKSLNKPIYFKIKNKSKLTCIKEILKNEKYYLFTDSMFSYCTSFNCPVTWLNNNINLDGMFTNSPLGNVIDKYNIKSLCDISKDHPYYSPIYKFRFLRSVLGKQHEKSRIHRCLLVSDIVLYIEKFI